MIKEPPQTILSDDLLTGQPAPEAPQQRVRPTLLESLERDTGDTNAEFFLIDGVRPVVAWLDADLALDYGVNPIREIHPLNVIGHPQVAAETFTKTVQELHK
jgi:hypothetical protein